MQQGMSVNRTTTARPVEASGSFTIGDLRVHRLGYGAMRLTGPGVWGPPRTVPRRSGCSVARSSSGSTSSTRPTPTGPYVSEELIREALYPYPRGLVIATKAGLVRPGPGHGDWPQVGNPEYLRQECEMSLRRLGLERDRSLSAPPHRSQGAGRRAVRALARPAAARGRSGTSASPRSRSTRSRPPSASFQSRRCRIGTTWSIGSPKTCSSTARTRGIGFIPWFPLPPDS